MKPIQFRANCDQTIERFKKKQIVAIVIEQDTRISGADRFSLIHGISKAVPCRVSRFNKSLYEAVAAINNISVVDVIDNPDLYEKELIELAKHYKSKDINHFVNNWIETVYDNEFIITDAKYIEQYAFLHNVGAFIVKVNGGKEERSFKQSLIPTITRPNFTISIDQICEEIVINKLTNRIKNFFKAKAEKSELPKVSSKRKRIIKTK